MARNASMSSRVRRADHAFVECTKMTTATADAPAIAGGKPAKTTPYTKLPRYGEEEMTELREAIAQGTLFYAGGKKVHELEKQFSTLRGTRHGIACSSGTAAIHSATMAI